jgi:hypothetical protein
MTPEAEEELVCRVPHNLYDRLAVGLRGEETGPPAPPSYEDFKLAQTPDLYWRLGEPSGTTVNDASPNNRDGTYSGTYTLAQAGLIDDADTAVLFNGGMAAITPYSMLNSGGQRSIDMWANRVNNSAIHTLVGAAVGDDELYVALSSNDVGLRVGGVTSTWTAAWPGTGVDVHIAVTFDDSTNTAELYIDGVSKGTRTNAGTVTAGRFWVANSNGFAGNWNGRIDEVCAFSRILTPTEIEESYTLGLSAAAEEFTPPDPPENVIATLDDDEWVISDVLDKSPEADASFLNTNQDGSPFGVTALTLTTSYQAADLSLTVTPEADGKLLVFWSADVEFENASGATVNLAARLSLFVDDVQTGQERRPKVQGTFGASGVDVVIPVSGTTAVEVLAGVEYVLTVRGMKDGTGTGVASMRPGKSGGLAYITVGN